MYCNSELKCLANPGSFHTRTNPTPERRIKQNDIDGGVQNVSGKLLKVNHHGIRRKWHSYLTAHSAHAVKSVNRILEIVVINVFNRLAKPDGLLSGPHA